MEKLEKATVAGGCFWCTEAIFKRLKGVESVVPGYSGGEVENPTYEQVSAGDTGHAEAIQLEFDPKIISYEQLLDVFFHLHDPTTKDRQGADFGPQYRSAVFYRTDEQRKTAEETIETLDASGAFQDPVVTEVAKFEKFYPAEDYHVNYYESHKSAGYCRIVIDPKIHKLSKNYQENLKEDYQNETTPT